MGEISAYAGRIECHHGQFGLFRSQGLLQLLSQGNYECICACIACSVVAHEQNLQPLARRPLLIVA